MNQIKITGDAKLYSDCNLNSNVISSLDIGKVYNYISKINHWYKLENNFWVYEYGDGVNPVIKETIDVADKLPYINPTIYNTNLISWKGFAAESSGDSSGDNSSSTGDNSGDSSGDNSSSSGDNSGDSSSDNGDGSNKQEDVVKVVYGPNGQPISENDIKYLTDNGMTRDQAINKLKDDDKYKLSGYQKVKDILWKPFSNALGAEQLQTTINTAFGNLKVSNLQSIFGLPYQCSPNIDMRIDGSNNMESIGRMYAQRIVTRMPLLIMVPGSPAFLAGYTSEQKKNAVNSLLNGVEKASMLDDLIDKPGKFYGLTIDWTTYYQYVNPMARACALYMGIDDFEYFGEPLGTIDWSTKSNSNINSVLNYRGGVAFYINSEKQISESFSNDTEQSMLADSINGISDKARQMQFLLGTASNLDPTRFTTMFEQDRARGINHSDSVADHITKSPNLLNGIINMIDTVVAGGKLIFPEIWKDSSFTRDYNVEIKLVSPDNDPVSVYLNVVLPIIMLLGFAMPKATAPSAYISPFLVRASYKGFFNVDMGIITRLSINRGGECAWTASGVPTEATVSFDIKELYGTLAMSSMESGTFDLSSNTSMMDYLGNLCGININESDVMRTVAQYWMLHGINKAEDFIRRNTGQMLDQAYTNAMMRLFGV